MKPHVEKVLRLWKDSVSKTSAPVSPYRMSQQLRSFAALFAPGIFYYYILNFPELKLEYIHDGTREVLGIDPAEITMEKLVEVLIPEEREPMAKKESVVVDFFLNFIDPEDALYYKVVYFFRIHDAQGRVRDMLHQATILTLTEDNLPEHVMVVHTDVSHLKFSNKNNLSFISLNNKQSYFNVDIEKGTFDPHRTQLTTSLLKEVLTSREKEIIQLVGQGLNAKQISNKLHISVHTVRTHRKNLLKKSGCKNTTQLVGNCLLEGVI